MKGLASMKKLKKLILIYCTAVLALSLTACSDISDLQAVMQETAVSETAAASHESESAPAGSEANAIQDDIQLDDIPDYSGEPYVSVNHNEPTFSEEEMTTTSFEYYSPLDDLDRCGTTEACIGTDIMPDEARGDISDVKPTGWINKQYSNVEGKYLYNRCHLIGYQLTAENDNERNLITGTRYMNTEGMLPFENEVAEYVKDTDNHVMYRVTPVFEGDNLVASGVHMMAESVEDQGKGVSFNVYVYNTQPGIDIDYKTGDSHLDSTSETSDDSVLEPDYILNTNSKKFHLPDCTSVAKIKDENKENYYGSRDTLIRQGYSPCGQCNP